MFYTQTISQAQNNEGIEYLLTFIEEFSKRLRHENHKEHFGQIMDVRAFSELPSGLAQEINDLLYPFGIKY